MNDCEHLGELVSFRPQSGIAIYQCVAKRTRCTHTESDKQTLRANGLAVCERCPLYVPTGAVRQLPTINQSKQHGESSEWLTCPHRGEAVGRINAPGCSCDRSLYACAEKNVCLKRLPPGMTTARLGQQMSGVTVCSSCEIPKLSQGTNV